MPEASSRETTRLYMYVVLIHQNLHVGSDAYKELYVSSCSYNAFTEVYEE